MREKLGLIPAREHVRRISAEYDRVAKEIAKELMKIDVAAFKELQVASIQKEIDEMVKGLNRTAIQWANKAGVDAYKEAMTKSMVTLEVLGAGKDPMFDNKAHLKTISLYANAMTDDLLRANLSIKNTVNAFFGLARQANAGLMQIQAFDVGDENIIADIIEETIAQGQARYYASNRIYEYLRLKLLDGQFIDRAGRHFNLRDYSRMVARTRLREMQSEAVKNTCEQYDNDLVQFSQHYQPCPICKPLEGRVFSLSGRHPTYPKLEKLPPIHPNCEHNINPTSEIALEFREKYA